MTRGGFGFHAVWQNLKAFVDRLDIRDLREKAGIAAPDSPTCSQPASE